MPFADDWYCEPGSRPSPLRYPSVTGQYKRARVIWRRWLKWVSDVDVALIAHHLRRMLICMRFCCCRGVALHEGTATNEDCTTDFEMGNIFHQWACWATICRNSRALICRSIVDIGCTLCRVALAATCTMKTIDVMFDAPC